MTALLFCALILAQSPDPSRVIQEQQQREAIRIGEEQRRQIERDQRERDRQYQEEMELAARRRREAEAPSAQLKQPMQPPEYAAPQIVAQAKPLPIPQTKSYDFRPIGIAMMVISVLSITALLIHRRFTS